MKDNKAIIGSIGLLGHYQETHNQEGTQPRETQSGRNTTMNGTKPKRETSYFCPLRVTPF